MDLFENLPAAVIREYAEKRETVPRVLCLGPDAADKLAEELGREADGTALVLFDRRTREVAGLRVLAALSMAPTAASSIASLLRKMSRMRSSSSATEWSADATSTARA